MSIKFNINQLLNPLMIWFLVLIKPVSNQGLACYVCMTANPQNDSCADPFSSIYNGVQSNCQARSMGKNGTFPARYCMKISGRILSVDGNRNQSYVNTYIYYRSCLVDNIMDSSKSLETTGNFRLKGFLDAETTFRVHGSMSLCTFDGCNHARLVSIISRSVFIFSLMFPLLW